MLPVTRNWERRRRKVKGNSSVITYSVAQHITKNAASAHSPITLLETTKMFLCTESFPRS
jgi:hypothetical protein